MVWARSCVSPWLMLWLPSWDPPYRKNRFDHTYVLTIHLYYTQRPPIINDPTPLTNQIDPEHSPSPTDQYLGCPDPESPYRMAEGVAPHTETGSQSHEFCRTSIHPPSSGFCGSLPGEICKGSCSHFSFIMLALQSTILVYLTKSCYIWRYIDSLHPCWLCG